MYTYKLYNGKKELGALTFKEPLQANFVELPHNSSKYETIKLLIRARTISDNGVDIVIRRYLDVRRKSRRQISLLLSRQCDLL